ncbi:MAG: Trk system potassium transport protein TrkA [Sphaerochaetaceae bacterium]|nr:Trk system potassium transport protein TrkA [Sphaerochaetaceae bacterium]
MYIVILGAGTVGIQLARQLIAENKDVALIEHDADKAQDTASMLDCIVINDEGNNLDSLLKAGIDKADVFVSVTASDETNLIACGLVSAEFPRVKTIARVRNIDYSRTKMISHSFLGIDHVINPEIEAAKIISYAITHGANSEIMLFENASLQMRDLTIKSDSMFVNKDLKTIRKEHDFSFLVAAIMRNDSFIIPSGDTRIIENDQIYFLSTAEGFDTIFRMEFKERKELNKVLIVGGGHITTYVADLLLSREENPSLKEDPLLVEGGKKKKGKGKKQIHIIERDLKTCDELAKRYPQAMITHADITEDHFQEEEYLDGQDLLVCATNNQELNLITSIYAKTKGVKKALALVKRNSYRTMARNLAVDMTVCLNDTVVNTILKHIRNGNIKNVHALPGGRLEVIEFRVSEESSLQGKSISRIKLPANSLIIFISRDGQDIIPTGDTIVRQEDHLVMILERKSIARIEALISG